MPRSVHETPRKASCEEASCEVEPLPVRNLAPTSPAQPHTGDFGARAEAREGLGACGRQVAEGQQGWLSWWDAQCRVAGALRLFGQRPEEVGCLR